MKTSSFRRIPVEPMLPYLVLLVSMITGLNSENTGHFPPRQYKGVVGENVSMHCFRDETKSLSFLYFQKVVDRKRIFFNGFHRKPLNPLPNTKMERNYTIMHIYKLELSHSGKYECCYQYNDSRISSDPIIIEMDLNVTAFFSKPEITAECGGGTSSDCQVTCKSHNGLPGKKMEWNVPENRVEMWKNVDDSEKKSSGGLVNISSKAWFNCSGGNANVSCSVDEVISDTISVCSTKPPADQSYKFSAVVIAATVLCLIAIVPFLIWYCKTRTTGTDKGSAQNRPENGQPEEVIALNNLPG